MTHQGHIVKLIRTHGRLTTSISSNTEKRWSLLSLAVAERHELESEFWKESNPIPIPLGGHLLLYWRAEVNNLQTKFSDRFSPITYTDPIEYRDSFQCHCMQPTISLAWTWNGGSARAGWNRESYSDWNSHIVLVPKPARAICFCLDIHNIYAASFAASIMTIQCLLWTSSWIGWAWLVFTQPWIWSRTFVRLSCHQNPRKNGFLYSPLATLICHTLGSSGCWLHSHE